MNPREETLRLDRQYLWRPYTSSEEHEGVDPLVITEARGPWLIDADGRRYLDGNSSWWTANLGHRHPRLVAALERQAHRLMHCSLAGTTHEPAAALAAELVAAAPAGLSRVFYSDDGSTAVEVALKVAFQYWQQNGRPARKRFIALAGAFHGDTVGAMSLGGIPVFQAAFGPLLFDVLRAPPPDEGARGWKRVVDEVERTLGERGDTVAGVVVEPLLQGAAGMRMWSAALLGRLREATRRADTFLIADEVFTGFGRTGLMWACDHASVTPDLLCTAKGLSGGVMPFAATLATERLYDGFRGDRSRALMHGHTFCGNPLGAAVAREVLAIYRDEDIIARASAKAARLRSGFERIAEIDGVLRVRSLGMAAAADLGGGGYGGGAGWRVFEAARSRGAYLRPLGDTVYLCPPLNIDDDLLDELLCILRDAISESLHGR